MLRPNAGGLDCVRRVDTDEPRRVRHQWLKPEQYAANSTEGSVITSAGKNVRLDSGTKMLLVTQASTSASAER